MNIDDPNQILPDISNTIPAVQVGFIVHAGVGF